MTVAFVKPSDLSGPVREAGGDNEVPRDRLGRPRIITLCLKCNGTGKGVSEKTGKAVKCPGSCGPKNGEDILIPEGHVLRSFTRTTTYIDVLEDKSNLEAWQMRMVLVGIARDQRILEDVDKLYLEQQMWEKSLRNLPLDADPEQIKELKAAVKEPKDALNRKAQVAKELAGAEDKANKGTELHSLSEMVDLGQELPKQITFEDVLDLDAYRRASMGFNIIHMERLVVCDELKVAGTPDRVSTWEGDEPLIAPDGEVFMKGDGKSLITDLKTGTVEYGGLKMAMQLAIYANSKLYDRVTGEREDLRGVSKRWGIIMNVPAGTGRGQCYWADLSLGWEAVRVAGEVRRLRGSAGKALIALPHSVS